MAPSPSILMTNPDTSDAHELSANLRIAVARLSRRVRAEKASDELSDNQLSALFFVVREGPQTLSALAEHERVKPPSMNRTVNGLVRAGYLRRESDPADGRKVVLTPTQNGLDFVIETRRRRDAWLQLRIVDLDSADRETLERAAVILRDLADS